MKKKARKLTLKRETLVQLTTVVGGATAGGCSGICSAYCNTETNCTVGCSLGLSCTTCTTGNC